VRKFEAFIAKALTAFGFFCAELACFNRRNGAIGHVNGLPYIPARGGRFFRWLLPAPIIPWRLMGSCIRHE